MIQLSRKPH